MSSLGYEHHGKGVKGKQVVTRLSALEMKQKIKAKHYILYSFEGEGLPYLVFLP